MVTHPQNLRFSLEDPARKPLMLRYPLDLHLGPRCSFGASIFICPLGVHRHRPLLQRVAMNAGAKRRGDDAGKDKNARSAPKRRTQASAAAPPESPASCTEEQRGEFSAPKAFVLHAARRDEVRAGGPNLVPPRSRPSPKH